MEYLRDTLKEVKSNLNYAPTPLQRGLIRDLK
jgi:hypothetical protein